MLSRTGNSQNDVPLPSRTTERACQRQQVALPARLTWKDARGATRFVSVVTRDVSEIGVFVECQAAVAIPLYRLVQFQIEPGSWQVEVPLSLRRGRVLGAVYRVKSATAAGARQGLALRLMVDPKAARRPADVVEKRATA